MISANVSKELRKRVYRREFWECALCGDSRRLQIHHVVPRGEGGPDTEQNLIALCQACHAMCHGVEVRGLDWTQEEAEQMCVEYLSDLYAQHGIISWNPWDKRSIFDR